MTQEETKAKADELIIEMFQFLPASKEAEKGKEHLYYNQMNAAKKCAILSTQNTIEVLEEASLQYTKSRTMDEVIAEQEQILNELKSRL